MIANFFRALYVSFLAAFRAGLNGDPVEEAARKGRKAAQEDENIRRTRGEV